MITALEIAVKKMESGDRAWKGQFRDLYSGRPVKRLGRTPHAYFAAYSGKELAGSSVIYLQNGRWIMDGLLVKPEFREMGVAKRLTAARLRYAAAAGAEEVWYSCDDGNLVTICCHLRFGFQKICPEGHRCSAATAHWYRLRLTTELRKKLMNGSPRAGFPAAPYEDQSEK